MSGRGRGVYMPGKSLGSAGKRQFAPNLASAGKRQTTQQAEESSKEKTDQKDASGRKYEKSRKKQFEKPVIVESEGLFSAGVLKAKLGTSGAPGGGASSGPSKHRRVKIESDSDEEANTSKKGTKFKGGASRFEETDEKALEALLGDEKFFISDIREDKLNKPLNLSQPDTKRRPEQKHREKPKDAIMDVFDQLDKSDLTEMALIQFPNVLSDLLKVRKDDEENPEVSVNDDMTPKGSGEEEEKASEQRHCLDGLPEGKIGKLQIYKSGKAKLLIGNLRLDVELGGKPPFKQEVVSIDVPEDQGRNEENSGNFVVLGSVKQKICCLPQLERYCSG